MVKHLFIVAFRNLLKYKQQTIISIIGLSIGFVCFALSAYWIRYEMSFDAFHKNASRIYQVRQIVPNDKYGQYLSTPPPLVKTLEKYFPEIKATSASTVRFDIESDEGEDIRSIEVIAQRIDSNFFKLFDVRILSGSFDFNDEKGILVTEKFAKDYFQTTNPIGKKLNGELHVRGVVKNWPTNTNLPFQIIQPIPTEYRERWAYPSSVTYIYLPKGIDEAAFKKKFEKFQVKEIVERPSYTIIPLKAAYYTEPTYNDAGLKFGQVTLFATLGLLVIICALFNYLNLYASHIRIRIKELSLRKVNGASNKSLFCLLSLEFILLLLAAFVIGFIGIEISLPTFKKFADIQSDAIHVYAELFLYIAGLLLLSLLLSFIVITYMRRQLFQQSVRIVTSSRMKSIFSKTSIVLQMVIGIGFIFCTTVYFKQIHTLGNKNPGFERKNRLTIFFNQSGYFSPILFDDTPELQELTNLMNELKSIPSIEEIMPVGDRGSFFPLSYQSFLGRTEAMDENAPIEYAQFYVNPNFIRFYELQLLVGKDFKPVSADNRSDVIINEAAAKAFGLTDPIGKTIIATHKPLTLTDGSVFKNEFNIPWTVVGMVKDFLLESPLLKVQPVIMACHDSYAALGIKYREGAFTEVKQALETYVEKNMPQKETRILNMEDQYTKQYTQESSLRESLALLAFVCVMISLFGIYSMVALNAEYRRKEIAVRKVNGASLFSIFNLFFKEYIVLLAIAAIIAFPIGYIVIKPWTEMYILQTEINWWLYLILFLLVTIVVFLTIIARVWQTAHINPSTELKKE